ncbi:MAG: hypothetical protein ABW310_08660 [Acidimicrobiales bacterium]
MHTDEPMVVVSVDTHAGPRLIEDLRPYCPAAHVEDFDRFAGEADALLANIAGFADFLLKHPNQGTDGHFDSAARLADYDYDGVAAGVIFHGARTSCRCPSARCSSARDRQTRSSPPSGGRGRRRPRARHRLHLRHLPTGKAVRLQSDMWCTVGGGRVVGLEHRMDEDTMAAWIEVAVAGGLNGPAPRSDRAGPT